MTRLVGRTHARAVILTLALAALMPQVLPMPVRAAVAPASQCAVIGGGAADSIAPSTPGDFRVVSRTKSNQITLGWVASYDAVGVAGYTLYRNGQWGGTLCQAGVDLIGTVMFDRLGGRTKTPVTYDLYAFDSAGNVSVPATLVVAP